MSKRLPPEIYTKLKKVDSIIAALTNPKNKGKKASDHMIDGLLEDLAYIVGELNLLYEQISAICNTAKVKN